MAYRLCGGDMEKLSEWVHVEEGLPRHMQEVKVYIDNPYFGSGERKGNAVFLAFDHNFYDAEEQILLDYVTKWKPTEAIPTKDET